MANDFQDITLALATVCGGFNGGKCFDDVAPWAVGGAVAGAGGGFAGAGLGALGGGGAAFLTSPNCGSNGNSPMTNIRQSLTGGGGGGGGAGGGGGGGGQ